MATNGTDLAYPHTEFGPNEMVCGEHAGLTKREEFAKAALQGILSNTTCPSPNKPLMLPLYLRETSSLAVKVADALIEALNA